MENGTTVDPDLKELEALRQQAEAFDQTGDVADTNVEDAPEHGDAGARETEQAAENDTQPDNPANEEAGKADEAEDAPKQQRDEPKPKTREEKEAERFARNWKRLQAERAQLERERAELERYRAQIAAQTGAQSGQESAEKPLHEKYSAAELEQAAEDFEAEGRYEEAKLLREEAALAQRRGTATSGAGGQSAQAPTAAQQTAAEQYRRQFEALWNANLAEIRAEDPEFADPQSAKFQAAAEILREYPQGRTFPDGIKIAAAWARDRVLAKEAAEAKKTLAEKDKEIARLQALLSPGSGAGETRGGARSFEEMSEAEQAAFLKRQAAELDGLAG